MADKKTTLAGLISALGMMLAIDWTRRESVASAFGALGVALMGLVARDAKAIKKEPER